jgi:uncharacterized protein (TIGR02246 family)
VTLGLLAAGCRVPDTTAEDPTPAIREMLARSAEAWNAGDLDRFVSDYADDPSTTFMFDGRPRHGLAWIRSHFAPRFAPGADRKSLRFESVEARALGRDHAMATARFVLFARDSITASGPFTLVLHRTGGQWKIIHDHTSSD